MYSFLKNILNGPAYFTCCIYHVFNFLGSVRLITSTKVFEIKG
jgi:hypothetical protein